MATIYYPPHPLVLPPTAPPAIFLAGSIDMGAAENWQTQVEAYFRQDELILLNPRRDDWDSSWEQSLTNPQFKTQVEWELKGMELAQLIVMYFAPQSQAPITLLELGLHARSKKLRICCSANYWRKGNVDVVSEYYQIPRFASLESMLEGVRQEIFSV